MSTYLSSVTIDCTIALPSPRFTPIKNDPFFDPIFSTPLGQEVFSIPRTFCFNGLTFPLELPCLPYACHACQHREMGQCMER